MNSTLIMLHLHASLHFITLHCRIVATNNKPCQDLTKLKHLKVKDLLTARHLRCHKQAGAGHRHGHCQQQSADSEYHSFASVPADYEFHFQSTLVLH